MEEQNGNVGIGGRAITNLWFVDDIDAFADKQQELEAPVESLSKFYTKYKMDISTVELQWLEQLRNHEKMFNTGIVPANEC